MKINHLPDDHASLEHMEERVMVSDVSKHPVTMANASKAYTESTSSSVKFLLAENDQLENEL